MDLIYVLVMDELALVAIRAQPRRLLVPLLAHFGLIVFVEALWRRFHNKLSVAMSIGTVLIEFAGAALHEIAAQLSLVIELEVLNVSKHLLSRLEMHLLLLPRFLARLVVSHGAVPVVKMSHCLLCILKWIT